MTDLSWTSKPELRQPALVAAFRGWNDASGAASAALTFIGRSFGSGEVARIDCESFFDFTTNRPTIRLTEGFTREVTWPDWTLHAATVNGADGDLLLLKGAEPALRWRAFADTVVDAARETGVRIVVTLGALLSDIPHTRPVQLTGIGSDPELVERLGFQRSNYEGPTGIVGVIHDACARAGMPSASLWAAVPHYVAAAPNPKAALALIRGFESVAGMAVEASELEEAAGEWERRVAAAVANDPDIKAFVEKLEESIEEVEEDEPSVGPIPSDAGDSIVRDFERFLRQRGEEDS